MRAFWIQFGIAIAFLIVAVGIMVLIYGPGILVASGG